MLLCVREEIYDMVMEGHQYLALYLALSYACTQGFASGHGNVFTAHIGIDDGLNDKNLAIFLSFKVTAASNTVMPGEYTDFFGNVRPMQNTSRRAQADMTPAQQHGLEAGVMGLQRETKKWVAKRILNIC
ncbi:hypothetical protein F5Y12DRAFT_725184, partial [Xylaria sp. FL1777]